MGRKSHFISTHAAADPYQVLAVATHASPQPAVPAQLTSGFDPRALMEQVRAFKLDLGIENNPRYWGPLR